MDFLMPKRGGHMGYLFVDSCSETKKAPGIFTLIITQIYFATHQPPPQASFIREMAKAHRLPPYALSSIWGRSKGAALRLVRRIPFISSLFICVVLVGIVVGVSKSAYGQDTQYGYQQVPPAANGVRGAAGPSWI